MSDTTKNFLQLEKIHDLSTVDRLVALLWWFRHHGTTTVEFTKLHDEIKNAEYPPINPTREKEKLRKDSRITSSDKGKKFSLHLRAIKSLDEQYLGLLENKPLPKSNALFEENDFKNTRNYIEKVIQQINLSYDYQLFDCCAVMLRRLLETLIIEVYENIKRADELKNSDGHFKMFSGLLLHLKNDKTLNLGRQTIEALESFKKIADSSAHNRRFNASKKSIDDKIDGVKLGVVELKQLAFNN